VAEWSKATDCKSVEVFYVGSNPASPTFVVDFREEKVGLSGQPSEALSFFFAVYRMPGWRTTTIYSSIYIQSQRDENRSESLPASVVSAVGTRTRPPESLGTKPSDTYDRRRKRPPEPVVFQLSSKRRSRLRRSKLQSKLVRARSLFRPPSLGSRVSYVR
jgi:hypothetical protein